MAINSIKDLVLAHRNGQSWTSYFFKNAADLFLDNRWFDISFSSGRPGYNARVGAALEFTPVVAERNQSIWFPPIDAGQKRYLQGVSIRPKVSLQNQSSVMFQLIDLVGYYPLIDGETTDPQTMDNAESLPRYASGEGVQMFLLGHISPATATGSATIVYVDSDGVEQTTTVGVVGAANSINRIASSISTLSGTTSGNMFIPLASGSKGVRSVKTITFGTAPGGLYVIYLARPMMEWAHWSDGYSFQEANGHKSFVAVCNCTKNAGAMPIVLDGASLELLYLQNGGGRRIESLIGSYTFVWN
jgi:hypothetical protein